MLLPKRQKHRKVFKGKIRGAASKGNEISFGQYALQSQSHERITSRQIESARQAMTRYIKRGGKIWIRIFPDKPFTKKPPEVTMGAGKGDVAYFVASVVPGKMLFEIDGVGEVEAKKVLKAVSSKLSVRTKIVAE